MKSSLKAVWLALTAMLFTLLVSGTALAEPHGGEANLKVPEELKTITLQGFNGRNLLLMGIGVSLLGMVFGLVIYKQLQAAQVHKSMLEVSELIYETCKTYLQTQMRFIAILEIFIGAVIVV